MEPGIDIIDALGGVRSLALPGADGLTPDFAGGTRLSHTDGALAAAPIHLGFGRNSRAKKSRPQRRPEMGAQEKKV